MNSSSNKTIILMVVLATFALASGLYAAVGDTLSVNNGSGLPGTGGHIVAVNLRNVTTLKALMFKVRDIPDSVTVTGVAPTGRAASFRAEWATFGGTVKILLFPTDGTTPLISSGNGAVCNLTVSVVGTAPGGTKATMMIDSLVAANNTNQPVTVYSKSGYFWYGTKGDVKYDGVVNLFDVLRLIDIALSRTPSPTEYERWAGDMDSNGIIDVVDISMAIDLAVASTPRMQDVPATETAKGSALLEMPGLPINFKGTIKMPLTLKTSAPVSGMQLSFKADLSSYQLAAPEVTELSKDMSVSYVYQNGALQVMVYSLTGEPIPAGEGAVLMLPVTLNAPLSESHSIQISKALVATTGGGRMEALFGESAPVTASLPESFALLQNNPNPFNMSTKITYEVPNLKKGAANVRLTVYNGQGQLVRVLEDQPRAAGRYTVNWDGRDEKGTYVSSGVYFYRMTADEVVLTKKLAVMK